MREEIAIREFAAAEGQRESSVRWARLSSGVELPDRIRRGRTREPALRRDAKLRIASAADAELVFAFDPGTKFPTEPAVDRLHTCAHGVNP